MKFKSIFCNHDYTFSEIVLPNGQKRIRKYCKSCEHIKIYCEHEFEILIKTYNEGLDLEGFEGSLCAFKELKDQYQPCIEVLLKCKNCEKLKKESLNGKELMNNNKQE